MYITVYGEVNMKQKRILNRRVLLNVSLLLNNLPADISFQFGISINYLLSMYICVFRDHV